MWIIAAVVVVLLVVLVLWWNNSATAPQPAGEADMTTTATTTTQQPPVTVIDKSTSTVDAIVASMSDSSIFASYFSSTGVSSMLTGKGPYTVFVPLNTAFALLPPGTLSSLSATALKRLIEYHVVSGRALNVSAESNGTIQALSKDPLNFNVEQGNNVAQVDSSFVVAEYKASNGVVYVIGSVLLPPQKLQ